MKRRDSKLAVLGLLVVATVLANAGGADDDQPTVGIAHRITDLILPGSELTAKPIDDQSPIVVRIENTRIHGTDFRYDIVYYGLEPGDYDLRDSLVRVDGSSTDDVPNIPIHIDSVLGEGQIVPNDLVKKTAPSVGGYRTILWSMGVIWVLGLAALVFWPRSQAERVANAIQVEKTLADQLRPYVESAGKGDLADSEKAELERLLLAYWHDELNLQDLSPPKAIAKMRDHETAGQLFRTLERWLHSPEGIDVNNSEVTELLRPYRDISAP